MPPLYGDEQTVNQQQSGSLQTHSNKFPIEREVILSLGEKNSKIPILHEYKQRTAGRVAIAPDAPIKQQAWVHEVSQMQESKLDIRSRSYQTSENYHLPSGIITTKPVKLDEEKTKSLSRTYNTIKDMISSRFGPNRKDVDTECEANLNNVAEELRKSNRSINDEEFKRQESVFPKTQVQDVSNNMQQYSKIIYGQYGYPYSYKSGQQNIPLPGQLQSSNQLQPTLPSGQSAQLHVTHHTPLGGIQTVHQTQINAYTQSTNVIQNSNRDYITQTPGGTINQNQISNPVKHPIQHLQQPSGIVKNNGSNCQSSQQIIHQNQHHQSPQFIKQHTQNMHQRQIIQQIQHSQQQQNSVGLPSPQNTSRNQQLHFNNGNDAVLNYQQYQQNRQTISRSHIDLPSTSRQLIQELRIPSQEVYYHYNPNRTNRYGTPQIYSKNDNSHQENEFQRRSYRKSIEKAFSQPHLSYNEGRNINDETDEINPIITNLRSEFVDNREKYEISVEESHTVHFGKNGSRTTIEEYLPETSCEIRSKEIRSSLQKDYQEDQAPEGQESTDTTIQEHIEEIHKKSEIEICQDLKSTPKSIANVDGKKRIEKSKVIENAKKTLIGKDESSFTKREPILSYISINKEPKLSQKKSDLEHGIGRLKIHQGSGSDYDKAGQSSSNVDSGRGSAVYSSSRRLPVEDSNHTQGQDAEWVDIVESELRSILEPKDMPPVMHSTLSDTVSSVTPPLPPLTPQESPETSRSQFSTSLSYGVKPNYGEYVKLFEKKSYPSNIKHRGTFASKQESTKKFNHLFGMEAGELTSTTGLDLDSMLDRSDSDLSTNDARTIRKQLEGLENMYSEVLKLLGGSAKKRKKTRGLASYGSVSSLPTSSVSSRPITRYHDKRRSHNTDDKVKKVKDIKSINKRFQRLESHVVTLARSVAHLSSEMRTQHLVIQEMETIRGEIAALRTQTNMAMVRSQSQTVIKDSELPALSNPSRVKKLTKFFGTEPPLIRLFLRELGYEKYAGAFEKEKVGMVELPYLSEERLQKMGVPLGPRLRILQEARISVCKDTVYVI